MSWQAYVDDHLLCEIEGQHLSAAAIIGHDGSVWAQSVTFPQVSFLFLGSDCNLGFCFGGCNFAICAKACNQKIFCCLFAVRIACMYFCALIWFSWKNVEFYPFLLRNVKINVFLEGLFIGSLITSWCDVICD